MKKIIMLAVIWGALYTAVAAETPVTPSMGAAIPDNIPPVIMSVSSSTHPDQNKWYNGTDVVLTWTATDNSGVVSYIYELNRASGNITLTKTTQDNRFTAGDLLDGLWYFHLQAVDATGNKSPVAYYMIKVDRTAPDGIAAVQGYSDPAKKALMVTDKVQNISPQPFFNWAESTDISSGLDFYRIYWGEDSRGVPTEKVTRGEFRPAIKAEANRKYYLRGSVVDKAGNESPVTELFVVQYDNVPPEKVNIGRANTIPSENKVMLHWERPEAGDVAGYNVYRKTAGKADFLKLNQEPLSRDAVDFTDTTVKRGEQYIYAVKAFDLAGNPGDYSQEVGVPLLTVLERTQKVSHDWDGGDTAVPGATITYQLDFSNQGYTSAHNVVFEDFIPDNTTYKYHTSGCSLPVKVYFWVTNLNDGAGGWTDKEPKNTVLVKKIKWVLTGPLSPVVKLNEVSGTIRYSVLVNYI
jgi:uncharacterized repeat protein (TIGR01451 family)